MDSRCRFILKAQSQSGGRKIGNSALKGGNFLPTNIVGMKTNRLIKFSVDLRPPTHCLLDSPITADDCPCFPIHLDQDVTTVSNKTFVLCRHLFITLTDCFDGLSRLV